MRRCVANSAWVSVIFCSGAHDRDGAFVQKYPAVDADTGKYH